MGHTPINSPGQIGHHFSGMAANESFGGKEEPPHIWIIDSLNHDIPFVINSFHSTISNVLRELDIEHALAKQGGELLEQPNIELAFWRNLDSSLWLLAVQSFHDYTHQNDPEKYRNICLKMTPESAETLLDKALLQNERASREVGAVFQQALLDEIDSLNKLKAMITHNMPTVQATIEMRTMHMDGSPVEDGDDDTNDQDARFLMTPVIVLTALEDLDLRVPLRRYVDAPQGAGPGGLRPA